MGIRFIYGRAGSGKSTFCLNEIKRKIKEEDNDNKLIYIVPEQYTFQRESLLLKVIGEEALLKSEVLSFKRMCNRVFDECGGRVKNRMNESGKIMLIHKILQELGNELVYFNKISREHGFTDIISEIIREFKKYNLSSEIIKSNLHKIEDKELKEKLQDLVLIYEKFNKSISENLIDGDDELTVLADKLKVCDIYNNADIWIDEFTTFTPQQMEIIKVLAKKCNTINITLCMDELGEGTENELTDVFSCIKGTEHRILEMMKRNNINYLKPININKEYNCRFLNNPELSHLEKSFFSYPFKVYKENINNIKLYKANNSYDEMETIAKEILQLVRDKGYRYRDIAVVCRNIQDYEKITTVIFNEYDIPYFLDKKIDILSNPLVVLILSSIEIYIKNWSYESVFKYLKSGLTDLELKEIDVLENYILANGIKGYRWTNDLEDNEEIEEGKVNPINIMKAVREPLMKFHRGIHKKSVREICTAIYEFLVELKVFDKINSWIDEFNNMGLQDKTMEYEQIPNIIIEVLDQVVEVIGNEEMDIIDFYKILAVGFESKEIGVIPVALDQVNIGDVARIKGRNIKALFLIGVNDGVLPLASKDEGILTDKDRDILKDLGLELSSSTRLKVFEEQFMVYTALTLASDFLMITYPMADFEGKSMRPSIIIPRIKGIFSKLLEESSIFSIKDKRDVYSKITSPKATFNELILALRRSYENEDIEEYWSDVYHWFINSDEYKNKIGHIISGLEYSNEAQVIPREKIRSLYSNDKGKLIFGVSRLEKYSECPFSYFIQYGLKAKDRKVYEFTAPDLGSFIHEIIDEFTNKVRRERVSWSQLDNERCKDIINELVDIKLAENQNSILNSNKRYQYFASRFKRVISKSVSVISEQMRRGEFEIFSNEFVFGNYKDGAPIKLDLPSGEEVYLTGRIDRIDTLELDNNVYVRIIDYKSGAKKFDLNELYYGLQMQLLVYLDAILRNSKSILKKEAIPGAILYFRIDDPIIKSKSNLEVDEIKKQVLEKLKMNGLLLKDAELVRAMDNEMETYSLVIPATFKKDGDFSSNSSVVSEEQFNILREYVNDKMIELCEDMLSGIVKIEPCKVKTMEYCSYCDYSSICQFDTSLKDNNYRIISSKKEEELWKLMKNKISGGEGYEQNQMD